MQITPAAIQPRLPVSTPNGTAMAAPKNNGRGKIGAMNRAHAWKSSPGSP